MSNRPFIDISLSEQRLYLRQNTEVLFQASVSTGLKGAGERSGSGCTPRGWLTVKLKIGRGCPLNTVFVGRRPTGEVFSPALAAQFPQRDWILTRILWLGGLEPQRNRYGAVDTLRRYIYIHGCSESCPMGVPLSHGCVRMHNVALMALFERVENGTQVLIRVD